MPATIPGYLSTDPWANLSSMSGTTTSELTKALLAAAGQVGSAGAKQSQMGEDALGPLMKYLKDLVGGDEQALMEAIRPQAATVLSQYDTAKRAVSEFSPRGGGRTATLSELPFKASDALTTLMSGAKSDATKTLGSLGVNLTGQGLQAQASATNSLDALLYGLLQKEAQNSSGWMSVLGDIGSSLIGLIP
jgi:hypothetical protein